MPGLVIEPAWLTLARTQIGVHEGVGKLDNKTVLQYFVDASHPEVKHDEVPWCAAFVGAILKRSNIKPSESLMARSYEKWGQPTPGGEPILGCVGVKKRKGGGWVGHVGFVVGADKTHIILLGGNQADAVGIAAFPRDEFTAFRWPANISPPKNLSPLPTTVAGAKGNVSQA